MPMRYFALRAAECPPPCVEHKGACMVDAHSSNCVGYRPVMTHPHLQQPPCGPNTISMPVSPQSQGTWCVVAVWAGAVTNIVCHAWLLCPASFGLQHLLPCIAPSTVVSLSYLHILHKPLPSSVGQGWLVLQLFHALKNSIAIPLCNTRCRC